MVRRIDFICIGAQRSGTTWLFTYLSEHPSIFMPRQKALHYFDQMRGGGKRFQIKNENYGKPIEWYHSFFNDANKNQILGECTPNYFTSENTARDIWRYNPNIKFIAILRNPSERTFSAYLYWKQRGLLGNVSFRDAIEREPLILEYGKYAKNLGRYFDLFPSQNIYVSFYDNILKSHQDFYDGFLKFLEVDPIVINDLDKKIHGIKMNIIPLINHRLYCLKHVLNINSNSIGIQSKLLKKIINSFIDKLMQINLMKYNSTPIMLQSDWEYLQDFYRKDILELEKMINKKLDIWKIPTRYVIKSEN